MRTVIKHWLCVTGVLQCLFPSLLCILEIKHQNKTFCWVYKQFTTAGHISFSIFPLWCIYVSQITLSYLCLQRGTQENDSKPSQVNSRLFWAVILAWWDAILAWLTFRGWDSDMLVKDFHLVSICLPQTNCLFSHRGKIFTVPCLNSSPPGQNGCHFADDTLKCIFLNEYVWI